MSRQNELHQKSPITIVLRNRYQAGFTLIELLVVVSIIVLLIAILLPSLSRTRELGIRTQCLSQVRQIALGVNNYAVNYSSTLPVFSSWDTRLLKWNALDSRPTLLEIMPTPSGWYSPASPLAWDDPVYGWEGSSNETEKGYTLLTHMVKSNSSEQTQFTDLKPTYKHILSDPNFPHTTNGPLTLDEATQPSKTATTVDTQYGWAGGSPLASKAAYPGSPSWENNGAWADRTFVYRNRSGQWLGTNAGFLDGHAAWRPADQIIDPNNFTDYGAKYHQQSTNGSGWIAVWW